MENHHAMGSSVVLRSSLWDFSVNIYSTKDVEDQSLKLQEAYQANINIILWCCWLEVESIELGAHLLDDVLSMIEPISSDTVGKLREVRRTLVTSGSFTKVQIQSVKKHILNAELMIEKVLLHRLQDLTLRFIESKDYDRRIAGENKLDLRCYLSFLRVGDAKVRAEALLRLCV